MGFIEFSLGPGLFTLMFLWEASEDLLGLSRWVDYLGLPGLAGSFLPLCLDFWNIPILSSYSNIDISLICSTSPRIGGCLNSGVLKFSNSEYSLKNRDNWNIILKVSSGDG